MRGLETGRERAATPAVPAPTPPPGGVTYAPGWIQALPYPIRNMLRRWRGMVGMMIGVGIALSISMTMLGVSTASIELYTGDYKKASTDLYVIQQGGTLIPIFPSDTPGAIKNARQTLAEIRRLPAVGAAVGVITWSLEWEQEWPRQRDAPTQLIAVMGVAGDPREIEGVLVLDSGRWVEQSNEIVAGSKLAKDRDLGLGSTLRISGRDFTVVGTGKMRGFGFQTDTIAFMEYTAFRQRVEIGDVVSIIAVETSQPGQVRREVEQIGSFAIFTPADLIQRAEEANSSGFVFSYILSGLALSIGALFVSNMLSRSVAERRLEFATLRAIGVPRRLILSTVAAEALLVSIVAGLLGIGISLLFGLLINATLAQEFNVESFYAVDVGTFAFIFVLAIVLGVVSGLMPARQATHVEPVEVLREA